MIKSVLWVGPRTLPEFSRIAVWLESRFPIRFVDQLTKVDALAEAHLVVLAQDRPGLLDSDEVAALRDDWPNVKIVSLVGNWCEGEQRTGSPLCAVERFYTHQWPSDPLLLDRLVDRGLGFTVIVGWQPLAVIQASSSDYGSALADTLALAGCRTIESRSGDRPRILNADFVVWDVPIDSDCRQDELRQLQRTMPYARILALCTFPREHEIESLMAAGVERVISQPFTIGQLTHAMQARTQEAVDSAA